jgi:carboxyl-terminal processing protease
MLNSPRYLRALVVSVVLLAVPAMAAEDLRGAYAAILRGDYREGQAVVKRLAETGAVDQATQQLNDWLTSYGEVVESRHDVKRRTLEWNTAQSRQALAQDRVYLALMFAARGAAYSLADDPYAGEAWVDELVARVHAEIERLQGEQKWPAIHAHYLLLERVRPKDTSLKDLREAAWRRARLELIYKSREELERRIEGVDYGLLRNAAQKIDQAYYERPDFRRAALGGLESIATLCETTKLHEYLDGVANPESRRFMDERLAALRSDVEASTAFTVQDFLRLFNDIKGASRKSVELPEGLLITEFTEGALAKLDDFTSMVWPADSAEFDKHMMGGFQGVGIQLNKDELTNRLRVVTPLENSPALEAGIQAGDLIVEVDGKSTKGWSTEDAVRNITGQAGTTVTLTIFRPSTSATLSFDLKRRQIMLKTVRGVERLDNGHSDKWRYILDPQAGIAYIRMTGFQPETARELVAALNEAREQGMRGLILDLRQNPGGLLDVAIDVVSTFLPSGDVVSTSGLFEPPERYRANGRAAFADLPLIVLANETSASASEILAGALQDHQRAMVLGERTYGKGSVQRVLPLSANARLKLTTAIYKLPSGRSPHKLPDAEEWGVTPDWEVKLNPKEYREVLKREQATYVIRAPGAPEPDSSAVEVDPPSDLMDDATGDDESLLTPEEVKLIESDPVTVPDADPQLETALLHLRVKLVADLPWPRDVASRPMSRLTVGP